MQSPFIGVVDTATDPILYKRYTDPTDILLVRLLVDKAFRSYLWKDIYKKCIALASAPLIGLLCVL